MTVWLCKVAFWRRFGNGPDREIEREGGREEGRECEEGQKNKTDGVRIKGYYMKQIINNTHLVTTTTTTTTTPTL